MMEELVQELVTDYCYESGVSCTWHWTSGLRSTQLACLSALIPSSIEASPRVLALPCVEGQVDRLGTGPELCAWIVIRSCTLNRSGWPKHLARYVITRLSTARSLLQEHPRIHIWWWRVQRFIRSRSACELIYQVDWRGWSIDVIVKSTTPWYLEHMSMETADRQVRVPSGHFRTCMIRARGRLTFSTFPFHSTRPLRAL